MSTTIHRPTGRPSFPQMILTDALFNVAEDLNAWLRSHDRVATGTSQNWDIYIKRFGNLTPKDIAAELRGVRYIQFALFGREPGGPPPPALILAWMKARGIRGRDLQSGRFRTDKEAARYISREIGRRGFNPRTPLLTPTMEAAILERNINNAIDTIVPDMALSEAAEMVDQFKASFADDPNIIVTTS